jgi:hypothetical protein
VSGKSVRVIGLIGGTDGIGHVAKLAGNGGFHGAQGRYQAQNEDGGNQNEFGGDDEPAFIAKQTSPDRRHDSALQ